MDPKGQKEGWCRNANAKILHPAIRHLYLLRYKCRMANKQSEVKQTRVDAPDIIRIMSIKSYLLMGPNSTATTCMFCQTSVNTTVKYSHNSSTHIAGALWCLACFMCCVPYCLESSKNSDHYCPNCQKYLGTYQK